MWQLLIVKLMKFVLCRTASHVAAPHCKVDPCNVPMGILQNSSEKFGSFDVLEWCVCNVPMSILRAVAFCETNSNKFRELRHFGVVRVQCSHGYFAELVRVMSVLVQCSHGYFAHRAMFSWRHGTVMGYGG